MAELLPCPFCGSKNIDLIAHHKIVVFVQCDNCGVTFPHFDSKEEAINTWNTRTQPDITKLEHSSLCETDTYKGVIK